MKSATEGKHTTRKIQPLPVIKQTRGWIVHLLILLVLMFLHNSSWSAIKTWVPVNGGDWKTAGNWSPSGVPVSTDDVIIPSDQTAAITRSSSSGETISLNGLTIEGNVNLQFDAGSANYCTLNITGTFTVASGKTFTVGINNAGRLNFTVAATAAGTINGTVFMNSYNGSGYDRTFTNNGNLTITNAGLITGQNSADFTLNSGATLQIGSSAGITTGSTGNIQIPGTRTYSAGANYVYNGTSDQNTGTGLPTSLTGDLIINNPGNTVTLTRSGTTIANQGLLDLTAGTFVAAGNLTMSATSTINRSEGSMTVSNLGTGAYNINYTGSSKATGPELIGSGLNNITVSLDPGQTLTLDANRTPDGNLSVSTGTLDLSTFTCSRSSAGGVLTLSNGAFLKIGGVNNFPSNYNTNTLGSTGTVEYYLAGAQTISPKTYGNLIFSGSGTKSITAGTTVSGNLSIASGASASIATGQNISVNSLTLGGINRITGTWGSTSSIATNKDNTYFGSTTGYLTVNAYIKPVAAFSGLTASQAICQGTAAISLSGNVSAPGPVYPLNGETVRVTINGITQNTTISGNSGGFSIDFNSFAVPGSETAYPITYSYEGGTLLAAAANNNSTTVTVKSLPSASAAKTDITCFNAHNGQIIITASNGSGAYAYSTDNGAAYQSSDTFTGLAPGQYKIRVKDTNTQCESIQIP